MPDTFAQILEALREYFGPDLPDAVADLIGHCDGLERAVASKTAQVEHLQKELNAVRNKLESAAASVLKAGWGL